MKKKEDFKFIKGKMIIEKDSFKLDSNGKKQEIEYI